MIHKKKTKKNYTQQPKFM